MLIWTTSTKLFAMINGHGNDWHLYRGRIVTDFSSNVVPSGIDASLSAHLAQCIHLLANYPEPDAATLAAKLAAHHGVDSDCVMVTNGSAEAFYLLAHHFSGGQSQVAIPAFAEYEDAASAHNHTLSFVAGSDITATTQFTAGVVWLGNPNNPDGRVLSPEFIAELCKQNPKTHFIVDEAYAALCPDFRSVISLVDMLPNLIVVRSLTKVFAIPGLRLGYIVANRNLVKLLWNIKMPWSVNALAAEAGCFIADNYQALLPDVSSLAQSCASLQSALRSVDGVEVTLSGTNYLLARLTKGSAAQLKQYLVEQHGLLIRNASNFRGLSPAHFRVATQGEQKDSALVAAIAGFVSGIYLE